MHPDMYIVICRGDYDDYAHRAGEYVLATRRVFTTREAAAAYADTINHSREALVVAGNFDTLRFGY